MSKKILIVDDEKLARDRVSRFIGELGFDFVLSEAESGLEALERIESEKPDLVLLDIQMPGLTGLEMLQQIENRTFRLIFQTAYDEFAIHAFEENACDYLLKPFDKGRLKQALDRALTDIEKNQKLEELEHKFRQRDGYLQRITIKLGGKIKVIDLSEVHCFVSRDHYTCVYTESSEYICDLSLTHLEKRLNPEKFIRCHRKNIVCVDSIKAVGVGENMTVQLQDERVLPVSRSRRGKVKQLVIG